MTHADRLKYLGVEPKELIEALNDEKKAEALMKAKGWQKKDLLARADLLTKDLSAAVAGMLIV